MKITKQQLKQIIREEFQLTIKEARARVVRNYFADMTSPAHAPAGAEQGLGAGPRILDPSILPGARIKRDQGEEAKEHLLDRKRELDAKGELSPEENQEYLQIVAALQPPIESTDEGMRPDAPKYGAVNTAEGPNYKVEWARPAGAVEEIKIFDSSTLTWGIYKKDAKGKWARESGDLQVEPSTVEKLANPSKTE